jgi:CPA2 family monovalent cation:H+ antiporter-2
MPSAMEITPGLSDTLTILGAAGIVIPAFARLKISPVIGFILVGIVAGPYLLGAMAQQRPWLDAVSISNPHGIEPFAEFGIILLLFSIGLELSFKRLWGMRRRVFGVGAAELGFSALLVGGGLFAMGNSVSAAVVLGLALAMSSTAPIIMPKGPAASAFANADVWMPHSFAIASCAFGSSWLSTPSRMIVSAVPAMSSFW